MKQENTTPKRMKEIEIFGIPALFTTSRIPYDAVYPGMFRYELLAGKELPDQPHHLTGDAGARFLGSVLTPVAIPMQNGEREIDPGDLFLDIEAGNYTPAEFEEKYLSPNYDSNADRYGKPD